MNKTPDTPATAAASGQDGNNNDQDCPGGHHDRDLVLSHIEARSAGPSDTSVVGEEDPGSALEYLVQRRIKSGQKTGQSE